MSFPFANPASNLPWLPSDNGWLATSCSVDGADTGIGLTAGTLYLVKIPIRNAMQGAGIGYIVTVAGVGASTGSFVGAYSSAGLQIAGSADIGANLTAVGSFFSAAPWTAAQLPGSFVWGAMLCNLATTQATIRAFAAANQLIPNFGISNPALLRCCTNGTGLTSLPASINPASNVQASDTLLLGIA